MNEKQGTYIYTRIKKYVQDPIVLKKDDNRSYRFFESFVSHEFQMVEHEVRYLLGECEPLNKIKRVL